MTVPRMTITVKHALLAGALLLLAAGVVAAVVLLPGDHQAATVTVRKTPERATTRQVTTVLGPVTTQPKPKKPAKKPKAVVKPKHKKKAPLKKQVRHVGQKPAPHVVTAPAPVPPAPPPAASPPPVVRTAPAPKPPTTSLPSLKKGGRTTLPSLP